MSLSDFSVIQTAPARLVVAEKTIPFGTVPDHIIGLFDVLHCWLAQGGHSHMAHNHAIYEVAGDQLLMRVGIPFAGPVVDDQVYAFELPGAEVAYVRHTGDYALLHEVSLKLIGFIRNSGREPGTRSWEVYGDWHEDPNQRVTDVYMTMA